ncbi:MAG: hypothetical protein V9G19_16715 [Tetrasphaera sp.]
MGDDDHAATGVGVSTHRRQNNLGASLIQVSGRFVGQNKIGLTQKRTARRDPLTLPAGHLSRLPVGGDGYIQFGEQFQGANAAVSRAFAAVERGFEDVVENRA